MIKNESKYLKLSPFWGAGGGNNHEIWHECTKCGCEFDLRNRVICPHCGTTAKISEIKDKE